jgi:hypothetical protein
MSDTADDVEIVLKEADDREANILERGAPLSE